MRSSIGSSKRQPTFIGLEQTDGPQDQPLRHLQPAEIGDRGIQVDELHQRFCGLAAFHARSGDDERCAATALEEGVLVPPLPLACMITVIADEDDKRLVPELMSIERI